MSSSLPNQQQQQFFKRQENVLGWNTSEAQQKIYNQTALILGTGGIGSSIAFCLARLGIRKIILTDCDVVEESNLNRQVLFTQKDVGVRKVDAAKKNLQDQHAIGGRTEIAAIHCDLIEEWGSKIEPLFFHQTSSSSSSTPTVVFNGCDFGEQFDIFVSMFCRVRNIPYCAAASYAHHADFEVFSSNNNKNSTPSSSSSCLCCRIGATGNTASLSLIHSMMKTVFNSSAKSNKNDETKNNHFLNFLPQDSKPETNAVGSSVLPCVMAGQLVVNAWINRVVVVEQGDDDENNNDSNFWGMMELATGLPEVASFPIEKENNCPCCHYFSNYSQSSSSGSYSSYIQNLELFSLAFSGEPVVLSSSPVKNSKSFLAPSHETEDERKVRIENYQQRLSKIFTDNNNEEEDVKLKKCLPNLAGHYSSKDRSNFVPCCPTVPFVLEQEEKETDNFFLNDKRTITAGDCKNSSSPLFRATTPLVKHKSGTVHGIRSGLRSAILPPTGPASIFSSPEKLRQHFTNNNNFDNSENNISSLYSKHSFNNTLRLKGCGCVTHDSIENAKRVAFPIASLDPPELKQFMPDAPDRWEIRGCQFLDTGIREAVVTSRLAQKLWNLSSKSSSSSTSCSNDHQRRQLLLGNYPVALWKYNTDDNNDNDKDCGLLEDGKKEIYGKVGKYCGVFQTLGDKRAEMHLLNGLEILLCSSMILYLLKNATDGKQNLISEMTNDIKTKIFAPKNRVDDKTGKVIPTWARTKGEPLIENAQEEISKNLETLIEFEQEFIFSSSSTVKDEIAKMLKENLDSPYSSLWKNIFKTTPTTSSSSSSSSVFAHIYERLGYEMGFFHGFLNGSDHSWGLFFDHNPCEPHNNAHPNNFIVVASTLLLSQHDEEENNNADDEKKSETTTTAFFTPPQYLAAVDFDMAYSKDEFINNFTGRMPDDDLFQSNIEWEVREMESVLGGNDQQSTGIVQGVLEKRIRELFCASFSDDTKNVAFQEQEKDRIIKLVLEELFPPLKILLRDLIVCSEKKGYEDGKKFASSNGGVLSARRKLEKTKQNIHNEKLMNLAVKLALVLTDRMNC